MNLKQALGLSYPEMLLLSSGFLALGFVIAAIYVGMQYQNWLYGPETTGVGVVTGRRKIRGGGAMARTPDRWRLELLVEGETTGYDVDPELYDSVRNGDKVRVRLRRGKKNNRQPRIEYCALLRDDTSQPPEGGIA